MEIFHNFNVLTYILALGFLGLWFLFASHKRWSIFMGIGFFGCLLANFLATVGFTMGPVKYFIFSKNLLLIGVFGFLFKLVRHNKIGLFLAVAASIFLSLHLLRIKFVENLVPKQVKESIEQGELLIQTTQANIASIQEVLQSYKGQMDKAFYPEKKGTELDDFYLIDIPNNMDDQKDDLLEFLEEKGLVQYGEYNDVIQIHPIIGEITPKTKSQLAVNDPMVPQQWAASVLHYNDLYKIILDHKDDIKKEVRIAVLDTGVDGIHEDLNGMLDMDEDRNEQDPVGHGTHCAGIIAAETNNKVGIASQVFYNDLIRIMPIKVLNRLGFGTQAQIIKGMIKAVDEGADVLSMSLGGISDNSKQKAYAAAVKYAMDQNAVVVTSAGNSNSSARSFTPANVEGVICVTALDENGQLAGFSNYLDGVEWGISAPGVNILSTYPGNQYRSLSGTSMAAPFVSSTIGIIKAFDPDLSPQNIYTILHDTSIPTSDMKKSGGLLQPAEALKVVLSGFDKF